MLKRVDEQENEEITGFSYINKDNEIEYVNIANEVVVEIIASGEEVSIYTQDIPKLILALQAAYEHLKGK